VFVTRFERCTGGWAEARLKLDDLTQAHIVQYQLAEVLSCHDCGYGALGGIQQGEMPFPSRVELGLVSQVSGSVGVLDRSR
jgi:hypothetical protein